MFTRIISQVGKQLILFKFYLPKNLYYFFKMTLHILIWSIMDWLYRLTLKTLFPTSQEPVTVASLKQPSFLLSFISSFPSRPPSFLPSFFININIYKYLMHKKVYQGNVVRIRIYIILVHRWLYVQPIKPRPSIERSRYNKPMVSNPRSCHTSWADVFYKTTLGSQANLRGNSKYHVPVPLVAKKIDHYLSFQT